MNILQSSSSSSTFFRRSKRWLTDHLKFIGPGIVASVAYLDPGNWATDIEAGSTYGYPHLFVVLLASLMAILLQILSTRLGYVTGKDLAQQCRVALYDRPTHKKLWRWCALYPLYAICEAGIIFTDLAELIGSAMALKMLFPGLPLYGGVLLTSLDVFIVLAFFNSYPSASNKTSTLIFELLISILVLAVLVSFVILLVKVSPRWSDVFGGFIPSAGMIKNGALYQAIGIIGATVMPHALFLGSKVAILDRVTWNDDWETRSDDKSPQEDLCETENLGNSSAPDLHAITKLPAVLAPCHSVKRREWNQIDRRMVDNPLDYIRSHLGHASFDIGFSLFTLALPDLDTDLCTAVNAAILIVAASAFYYTEKEQIVVADLFSAHELLATRIGKGSAYVFAIALLLSGQAASITVTLAGQIVSEGFLQWRTNPVVRRLVTRSIGIVPSAIVAGAVGVKGMDNVLVGSQVALSLVLPFVIAPLLIFTSNKDTMSVRIDPPEALPPPSSSPKTGPSRNNPDGESSVVGNDYGGPVLSDGPQLVQHFANGKIIVILTSAILVMMCAANAYGIIQLATGS
ncbi:natural resistance-associated macrophage protein-domain-containing protein [Melampsora americana]|nr:natural resistance-associated macrophage protein-domain-containing protein [Melampsora americana]